ncbi:MAG: acyltransferase family protein, partial [Pseudomonadota bacterium]
ARMDGANAWQALRYVTVPQLRPMIFFAGSITLITGISGDTLARYLHYMAYIMGDYGATAAMAATILLILTGLLYVLWAYIGGRPELPHNSLGARRQHPMVIRAKAIVGAGWHKIEVLLYAPASTDPQALRGFNGMRAIACLMVVVHHLAQRLDGERALVWVLKPLWRLGLHFDMGVCLFFVLSGALLSMPFWERFFSGEPAPSLGQYAARRAARIVPGYWLALILSVAIGLVAMPEALLVLPRFLAGLGFVSGLHYTTLFPSELDPVLWSISFEVMCYVLLPLLLLPAWRWSPDRNPQRTLRYLIGVLIALQLAHLWVVANFMTEELDRGWRFGLIGGAKQWIPYWNPATFMTQFMLGSLAAFGIVWKTRVDPRRGNTFDTMARWALIGAIFLLALFGGGGHNSFTRQPYITPVFPALCAVALFAMHFGRRLHLALDNRLFNFVATISFGLYLWHFPVIELLRIYYVPDFLVKTGVRHFGEWFLWSTLVMAISTMLAWLSWRWLEQPALLWVKRRLRKPQNDKPAQGALA